MRGGAQSHLLEAADGQFYVVKFLNNPQHRRILINEWIGSTFLRYLQISAPDPALIEVTPDFLAENPEVHLIVNQRRTAVEPGWHFGSRYPGDPTRLAVYDFLPDTLLTGILNYREFLAALVFDKWMGNADSRQAIFFRAAVKPWTPHPQGQGFVAAMIDHGYVFAGPQWEFADGPAQGLYFRRLVYESVRGLEDFQPWLDQIRGFPAQVVDEAMRGIPPQWLDGDRERLELMLERLMVRRGRVISLIEATTGQFPRWA